MLDGDRNASSEATHWKFQLNGNARQDSDSLTDEESKKGAHDLVAAVEQPCAVSEEDLVISQRRQKAGTGAHLADQLDDSAGDLWEQHGNSLARTHLPPVSRREQVSHRQHDERVAHRATTRRA
jgi:hypothetical protein